MSNVECQIKESSRFYNYQTTEQSDFLHLSFDNCHSTFFSAYRRFLDPSRSAVKADGNRFPLDNDRNLAGSLGVLQHGVKIFGLFDHIIIGYLAAFFGKCFTSCPGVWSSILSENQNFVGHFFPWLA